MLFQLTISSVSAVNVIEDGESESNPYDLKENLNNLEAITEIAYAIDKLFNLNGANHGTGGEESQYKKIAEPLFKYGITVDLEGIQRIDETLIHFPYGLTVNPFRRIKEGLDKIDDLEDTIDDLDTITELFETTYEDVDEVVKELELFQIYIDLPSNYEDFNREEHVTLEIKELLFPNGADNYDPDNRFLLDHGILASTVLYYQGNEPSYGERFTASIIIDFADWALKTLGMKDVVLLVFNKNPREDQDDSFLKGDWDQDSYIMGIFPESLYRGITYFYGLFERFLPIPLVLIVCILGFSLAFTGKNAEKKSQAKDYTNAFVIALLSLRFGGYLWYFIFAINNYILDIIWYGLESYGIKMNFFLDMIWGNGAAGYDSFSGYANGLGVAFIVFMAAMMTGLLNYQYSLRIIFLSVLIFVFPAVAILSIHPKFRHSMQIWYQEFIANVFLPIAHAVALALFFITLQAFNNGGISFWLVIAYFFGLPVIVNLFRKLMNLENGNGAMGNMGAMMGVMAIGNMARMFKSNPSQGGSTKGDGGNGKSILDNPLTQGNNTQSKLPGTQGIERKGALASIFNSGRKALGSNWVKAPATMASGALGATVSTMATGNPSIGMVAGIGAAKAASNVLGKVGNTIQGGLDATDQYRNRDKSITPGIKQHMESSYMNGTGGKLNNSAVKLGWGAQRLFNAGTGGQKLDYVKNNKEQLKVSTQNMNQLQPHLNLAKEKLTALQSQYGPGSKSYNSNRDPQIGKFVKPEPLVKAEQEYHKLNAEYTVNKYDAMESQYKLTNYQNMTRELSSSGRGTKT
ncbi:hypothetical protein EPK97_18190 [Chengkuizengella sediminis]|nr:hypothetical protein [Chengkuizengella sediminis]